MKIAILIHLLFAVIWVGGMFFAYTVLRPTAVQVLEPPERLALWVGVFGRFFPWVWGAIFLLPASGFYLLQNLGATQAIHAMMGIWLIMTLVFFYIFFLRYPLLKKAVAANQWKTGGEILGSIRKLIAFNLSLGLLEVLAGVFARGF